MTKIIHQIWVGDKPIPEIFLERSKKISEINFDYELIIWREDRIIEEFPHLEEFIKLECVPTFISDITRIEILKKYGGWYIDFDFEIILETKLEDLCIIEKDIPIIVKYKLPGFFYINGFFYSPKNHQFLYDENFKSHLPDHHMMIEFNKAVLNLRDFYVISSDKISREGTDYREEIQLSFYNCKNFNKFLIKKNDKLLLEMNSEKERYHREENLKWHEFYLSRD